MAYGFPIVEERNVTWTEEPVEDLVRNLILQNIFYLQSSYMTSMYAYIFDIKLKHWTG